MEPIRAGAAASAAASPSPECLVWEAGSVPLRIMVHPRAAERMRREAARPANNRKGELGGLLIGSVERDGAVLLEDAEPVQWPGSPVDNRRELEAALARHAAAGSLRHVIGFYRTHSLSELFLNAGDLVLIKHYFPDPANVFLLLKAGPEGRLTARYFFRRDGLMRSEGSEPGFPFGRPVSNLEPPLPIMPVDDGAKWRMPRAAKAATYTLAVAITAAASLYFARAPKWPSWSLAATETPAAPAQLSLEVEKRGRDLLLKWDRNSEPVQHAQRAVLDVEDGAASRRYDVELVQLRTGSIYYTPTGTDVQLRLEVYWDADRRAVESVRVLSAGPPPEARLDTPEAPPVLLPPETSLPPTRRAEPARIRRVPQQARTTAMPLRFTPQQPRQNAPAALDGPSVSAPEQARGRAAVAAAEGIPGLKPSVTVTVPAH